MGGGWTGCVWEISVPYAQFCCEAKTALKNKRIFKKMCTAETSPPPRPPPSRHFSSAFQMLWSDKVHQQPRDVSCIEYDHRVYQLPKALARVKGPPLIII